MYVSILKDHLVETGTAELYGGQYYMKQFFKKAQGKHQSK